MNKSKEAIRDLRNSFELRHCKWAKKLLRYDRRRIGKAKQNDKDYD